MLFYKEVKSDCEEERGILSGEVRGKGKGYHQNLWNCKLASYIPLLAFISQNFSECLIDLPAGRLNWINYQASNMVKYYGKKTILKQGHNVLDVLLFYELFIVL